MRRPDVTAAFVLASSIAILASEQEYHANPNLLPPGTAHLAGYGFIGTITALVAAGRLDLPTGVRLAVSPAMIVLMKAHHGSSPSSPVKNHITALHHHRSLCSSLSLAFLALHVCPIRRSAR